MGMYPRRRRRRDGSVVLYSSRRSWGGAVAATVLAVAMALFGLPLLVLGIVLDNPEIRWTLLGMGVFLVLLAATAAVFAVQLHRHRRDADATAALTKRMGVTFALMGVAVALLVGVVLAVLGLTGGLA